MASACRPADSTKVSVFVSDTTNWDIDNPYLYTVTAKLQRRNETFDEVTVKTVFVASHVIQVKDLLSTV